MAVLTDRETDKFAWFPFFTPVKMWGSSGELLAPGHIIQNRTSFEVTVDDISRPCWLLDMRRSAFHIFQFPCRGRSRRLVCQRWETN